MVYINYNSKYKNKNLNKMKDERRQIEIFQIINNSDESSFIAHDNFVNQSNPFQSIKINQVTVQRNIIIIIVTNLPIVDVKIVKKSNHNDKEQQIVSIKQYVIWQGFAKKLHINIIKFNCQAMENKQHNNYAISFKKKDNFLISLFKTPLNYLDFFTINSNNFHYNQLIIVNKAELDSELVQNLAILSCLKHLAQNYKIKIMQNSDKQRLLEQIFVWFKLFYDRFHKKSQKIQIQKISISEDASIIHTMLLFYFLHSVSDKQKSLKNAFEYLSTKAMINNISFRFNSAKLSILVCSKLPYSKELSVKYMEMQLIYSIIQKQNNKLDITQEFFTFLLTEILQRTNCSNISQILQAVSGIYPKIVTSVNKIIRLKICIKDKYNIYDYFNIRIKYINELVKVLTQEEAQNAKREFLDDLIQFLEDKFEQTGHFDNYQQRVLELFVRKNSLNIKNQLKVRDCVIAQFYWKCKYIALRTNSKLDFKFVFQPFLPDKCVILFNYSFAKIVLALMIKSENQNSDLNILKLLFSRFKLDYHNFTNVIIQLIKNQKEEIYDDFLFQEIIKLLVDKKQFKFESFLVTFNGIYNEHHEKYKKQLEDKFSLFMNKFAKIHFYSDFYIATRTESAIMENQRQFQKIQQNRKNVSINYSILQIYYRQVFKFKNNKIKQMFIKHINQQLSPYFTKKNPKLQDYLNQLQKTYA